MNYKYFSGILFFLFISFSIMAQAPQGISYQAIAFDTNGDPIADGTVGVQISILDNSPTGTTVYSETHTPSTNSQGLFYLNIGEGSPSTGSFSSISWGENNKFLKVEIDPTGGTSYINSGTNQLMSVPYALFSENTNHDNLPPATGGDDTPKSATTPNGAMLVVYTSTNAYGFTINGNGNPNWYSTSISGTVIGAAAADDCIVVYTSTNAYGFMINGVGNPNWYSTSISGTPQGISPSSNNTIVVYTTTNAYGFTRNGNGNPNWYSTSISGTPKGITFGGNLVVYTTTNAYGFTINGQGNPNWYSTSISGTVIGASSVGERAVVYTSTNAYGFTINGNGNPNWYSTSMSGTPQGISPE